MWRRRWVLGLAAAWVLLCTVLELAQPEPSIPSEGPAVALVGAPIPKIGLVARHTWLLVRGAGESRWERWEMWQDAGLTASAAGHVHRDLLQPLEGVGAGKASVEWLLVGEGTQAAVECVRREAPAYQERNDYRVWPGPNSNTFTDTMIRRCQLGAPMTGTAVGKDWQGWFFVGSSRQGTGLEVEVAGILGLVIGIREGVELHALGTTVGVDLWPPALIVPFGDGRLGWD